jgi:hypothetical protein
MVCTPVTGDAPAGLTLERDYFGLGRLDWTDALDDPGGIEFNMEISSWLRLFRTVGFDVVDYVEIQAPASATGTQFWVGASGRNGSRRSRRGSCRSAERRKRAQPIGTA